MNNDGGQLIKELRSIQEPYSYSKSLGIRAAAHIAELETELANAQTTLEADLEYQRKLEAELAEALAERDAYSDQTDQQDLDIKFLSGRNTALHEDLDKANKVIDAIAAVYELQITPNFQRSDYATNGSFIAHLWWKKCLGPIVAEYRKKAGS